MSQIAVHKAHIFTHGKYSQQLVRTSTNNLKAVYRAAGFADVQITPQIANREGNLLVTFRVDEGPQDRVETLRIEGNTISRHSSPKG